MSQSDRYLVKNRMCLPLSVNFGPGLVQYLIKKCPWWLVGATKNEPVFSIAGFVFIGSADKLPIILYYYLWDSNLVPILTSQTRFEQTCCGISNLDGNGLTLVSILTPKLDELLQDLSPKIDQILDLDGNELSPVPDLGRKLDGLLQDLEPKLVKLRLSSNLVVKNLAIS